MVGAPVEDSNAIGVNGNGGNNSATDSGAAYVFNRSGVSWSQQAYLKASNTDAGDWFGSAVAISGEALVVGSPYEDSNASGVNGNGSNNSAPDAGAAYAFGRSGSTWSQSAYLKASNTNSGDDFGYTVAIFREALSVGAWGEDSSASGVNGNESDNSAPDSGAVYLFARPGSTWSQRAYLKASNPEASDGFGWSAAITGGALVVGAPYEDSRASWVNGDQSDNSASASGSAYVFDLFEQLYLPMIARQP